ncbi:hypothetical protein Gpo141_00003283 [Globisporangium polare]
MASAAVGDLFKFKWGGLKGATLVDRSESSVLASKQVYLKSERKSILKVYSSSNPDGAELFQIDVEFENGEKTTVQVEYRLDLSPNMDRPMVAVFYSTADSYAV